MKGNAQKVGNRRKDYFRYCHDTQVNIGCQPLVTEGFFLSHYPVPTTYSGILDNFAPPQPSELLVPRLGRNSPKR